MKVLKLAYGVEPTAFNKDLKAYRVISVKNSVAYHPGEILHKSEVSDLCANAAWDVVILPLTQGAV